MHSIPPPPPIWDIRGLSQLLLFNMAELFLLWFVVNEKMRKNYHFLLVVNGLPVHIIRHLALYRCLL